MLRIMITNNSAVPNEPHCSPMIQNNALTEVDRKLRRFGESEEGEGEKRMLFHTQLYMKKWWWELLTKRERGGGRDHVLLPVLVKLPYTQQS